MQVSVAIVPPEHVRAAVMEVVERVKNASRELDLVAPGSFRLPLIGLGNLTRPDADRLCEELARRIGRLELNPRVRLAGVWALEDAADPSVAMHLDGDVDGVVAIAKALPEIVTDHDFFVDRRAFVTRIKVATVTDRTTLPVLEKVVEALGDYTSPAWEVGSIEVLSRVRSEHGSTFEVFESLATAS